YTFEGLSIMSNIAMTIIGMWVGTIIAGASQTSRERTERFFAEMDRPIQPEEIPAGRSNPAAPVLALSTFAVGLLLAIAGAISGSRTAQIIDFSTAAVLVVIGFLFRRNG